MITAWQKMFLCVPAGLPLSVETLKTSSFMSFFSSISGAMTFGGNPSTCTLAAPSNGWFTVTPQTRSVFCPCSTAAR